jgi:hypothetical protein
MKRNQNYIRGRQRNKKSIKIRFLSSDNKKQKYYRGNSAKYTNGDAELFYADKFYNTNCTKYPQKLANRCSNIKHKKIINDECHID